MLSGNQLVCAWTVSKSSLAERFSAEFSNLNLVEVLAEFSLPSSLREHMDALSSRCQQVGFTSVRKMKPGLKCYFVSVISEPYPTLFWHWGLRSRKGIWPVKSRLQRFCLLVLVNSCPYLTLSFGWAAEWQTVAIIVGTVCIPDVTKVTLSWLRRWQTITSLMVIYNWSSSSSSSCISSRSSSSSSEQLSVNVLLCWCLMLWW